MAENMPPLMPGFVLVHGYSGSPRDLEPLGNHLSDRFGHEAVFYTRLPGHMTIKSPRFDQDRFVESVAQVVDSACLRNRPLIMIGHSTGGTVALKAISEKGLKPAMLFLAGTPKKIDGKALERWELHRRGKPAIHLGDTARMVSAVNRTGDASFSLQCPLLVLHGTADSLVPVSDALEWVSHRVSGPVRQLLIPGADHDIFRGKGGVPAADWIARMVRDFLAPPPDEENAHAIERLVRAEGRRLRDFLSGTPSSRPHILRSPGARQLLGLPFQPLSTACGDPVQINVETTTRCNLRCAHCARRSHHRQPKDMPVSLFEYLLDLMPNTYRVVLAGLGEPTLHPQIEDLARSASERRRLVGLVTNATRLDGDLANRLINAGIAAVTFSLDSADDRIVSEVRPGVRIDYVLENIREFARRATGADIATAVFTAVSTLTVEHLPRLAETIAGLGVQAWMLTDLNFDWNQPHSLAGNWNQAAGNSIRSALKIAFSQGLPVLSINGLEAFGMTEQFRRYLLYPPERLSRRSRTRTQCLSPWQTLPVDVEGNATFCDCQPDVVCGNLRKEPFSSIWNGETTRALRIRMTQGMPPKSCLICPRF